MRLLASALALAAAWGASGCAWIAHREVAPTAQAAPGEAVPEPAALDALIAERRAAVHALRATGKLELTVDARRGEEIRRNRMSASQAILVETPSSFRLEALSPFGVSYAVASDGREIAVLIPSEGVVYRGVANLATVATATGVAASPDDVAVLLLGLPPVPPLDLKHAWVSRPGGTSGNAAGEEAPSPEILLHATTADDQSDLVVAGFAAAVPNQPSAIVPVLYERLANNGKLVLRARFGAFRETPAGPVATRVEIQAEDTAAVLRYSDLEVNPALEANRFEIHTPAGSRELRLDAPTVQPAGAPA